MSKEHAPTDKELLDTFMGQEDGYDEHGVWRTITYKEWNQLMPVVEKIESLHDASYPCRIVSRRCIIYDTNIADQASVYVGFGNGIIASSLNQESKRIATYKAIVAFIKWYNTQNEKV